MSNKLRKIQRQSLKNQFQTNKISEWFHAENDTLEKKTRKIRKEKIKNEKNK